MTLGGQYGCCVADMSCGDEKMRTAVVEDIRRFRCSKMNRKRRHRQPRSLRGPVNDRIGRPVQQRGADGVAGF
jgi:hypothetical protein